MNKQIDDNGEAIPTGDNIQLQAGGSVSTTPCPCPSSMAVRSKKEKKKGSQVIIAHLFTSQGAER
jgi:hypothetical protein